MATQAEETQRDAFAERLFGAALGAYELMTVHLGDRLGYYRALAERDDSTSAELAAATDTQERSPGNGSSSRPSPASSRSTTSGPMPENGATGFPAGTPRS